MHRRQLEGILRTRIPNIIPNMGIPGVYYTTTTCTSI